MKKIDIRNTTLQDLEKAVIKKGYPAYRARQVFLWLFQKGAVSFDKMTDIPKPLIQYLENYFYISPLRQLQKLVSRDSSIKIIFLLEDGSCIEAVVIQSRSRNTICLSTQSGCKFKCAFCASGMKGFKRNLSVSEILGQILHVRDILHIQATNYVFMGMGEPLDNYDNLIQAIRIMNDKNAFNIGARRITISTCGIVPGIKKLSAFNLQVNLSLSLHAVTDEKRSRIMPVNRIFPLGKLIEAMSEYARKSGRIITLEYILIPGVNDSISDAEGLAQIAGELKSKINLIPYSEVLGARFTPPTPRQLDMFISQVKRRHEYITIRQSRGRDIQAACGQLAAKQAADIACSG
ncbi:MAG: 23S rRNA (adenine(2503)-C(2))-methyltransferase RlmN [Candidatus Omnitrophica bacterium]|jgi:23S rRNA (adenine2503-C2)-methyltransferase|nr:23S rRNA (adenine(2503)-C(2))-methyltransferase RlmN [Candidatus Omnitrophota bacterium]